MHCTKPVACSLACLVFLVSCGGSSEDKVVEKTFKKQEATTLKNEGTAENATEKARREEERAEKLRKNAAIKRLMKLETALKKAEAEEETFSMAEALASIAEMGKDAEAFAAKIEAYLGHEDVDVRCAALSCLVGIQGKRSQSRLLASFKDKEDMVRVAAVRCWRKAGIKDVGPVLAMLDDFASDVQYEAVKAIKVAGADAAVLDKLIGKVSELDGPAARLALALAFEQKDRIGGHAAIVPVLVELMDHQDPRTRLVSVTRAHKEKMLYLAIAKKLADLMGDDPDLDVRKKAFEVLGIWAGGAAPAYKPDAEDDELRKAARAWSAWVEANATKFSK